MSLLIFFRHCFACAVRVVAWFPPLPPGNTSHPLASPTDNGADVRNADGEPRVVRGDLQAHPLDRSCCTVTKRRAHQKGKEGGNEGEQGLWGVWGETEGRGQKSGVLVFCRTCKLDFLGTSRCVIRGGAGPSRPSDGPFAISGG